MDKYRKDIKKKKQDKRKDSKLQQQQKEYLDKDPQVLKQEFLKLELLREQERLNDPNLKSKRKILKQVLVSHFKIDIKKEWKKYKAEHTELQKPSTTTDSSIQTTSSSQMLLDSTQIQHIPITIGGIPLPLQPKINILFTSE